MIDKSNELKFRKHFWQNVDYYRHLRGLSWTRVVGSNTALAKSGELNVTLGRMMEIAEIVGQPVADLLGDTPASMSPHNEWVVCTDTNNNNLFLETITDDGITLTLKVKKAMIFTSEKAAYLAANQVPYGRVELYA